MEAFTRPSTRGAAAPRTTRSSSRNPYLGVSSGNLTAWVSLKVGLMRDESIEQVFRPASSETMPLDR